MTSGKSKELFQCNLPRVSVTRIIFFKTVYILCSVQSVKKETPTHVFSCGFCEIFKKSFFQATVSQNMKAYI